MSINQFLSGLPAIIAILGFVIYQLLQRFGQGDRLTQSIVDKLKSASPALAEKYPTLGPAQLERLLKQDQKLRKLVSDKDYKLLGQALQHQFVKSMIVYVIVAVLFVIGLVLYARTLNQPSPVEKAAFLNAVDAVTKDNAVLRQIVSETKNKAQSSPEAPLPPELIEKVKALEARIAELEGYKSRFNELPKSVDPSVLDEARKTVEEARSLGDTMNYVNARIAEKHLSPRAASKVNGLLGNQSLSDPKVVNWAADQRMRRPETRHWSYVEVPIGAQSYDASAYCPAGDCIIAKTAEFAAKLADTSASPDERKEALLFLVSYVGYLHRPLHCATRGSDAGGNKVRIATPGGKVTNFHLLWDRNFFLTLTGDVDADTLALNLDKAILPHEREEWVKGSVQDWAWESHKIAAADVYGSLPISDQPIHLPSGYEDRAKQVITLQLKKGGVRLAFMINEALGTQ